MHKYKAIKKRKLSYKIDCKLKIIIDEIYCASNKMKGKQDQS